MNETSNNDLMPMKNLKNSEQVYKSMPDIAIKEDYE